MEHAAYTDATKSLLDYDSQASTPESEIDEEKALLGHWTKPAHNDRHIDAAIARPLASRPQYTIIIPPPSREMMRKRERDLLNFDIEMNRLIEEDEDDGYQSPSEPVRQYEVVVEDERGIHTVERRPLKSDWDSVDAKASKRYVDRAYHVVGFEADGSSPVVTQQAKRDSNTSTADSR